MSRRMYNTMDINYGLGRVELRRHSANWSPGVHTRPLQWTRHSFHGFSGSRRDYGHQNGHLLGVSNGGSNGGLAGSDSPRVRMKSQSVRAVGLLEELRHVVTEGADSPHSNGRHVYQHLPRDMQDFLRTLVPSHNQATNGGGGASGVTDTLEDNVRKLEDDRESLMLQVSVLTDQVEAQGDKIRDLETSIDTSGSRKKVAKNVANQHELISRTTLETHKLDLMAEISNLKLKLATSEKERREADQKLAIAQKRIDELQSRLNDRTIELTELRTRSVSKNGTLHGSHTEPPDGEVEKLKRAVEALMQTNSEKDRHIEEQRKMMKKYQRIEELLIATQGKKALEHLGLPDDASDSSSTHNSTSSNENNVRTDPHTGQDRLEGLELAEHLKMPYPSATSTPGKEGSKTNGVHHMDPMSPPSRILNMQTPSPRKPGAGLVRSNSAEDLSPLPSKTPPTVRRHGTGYAQEHDDETLKDEMAQQYKLMRNQNQDPNVPGMAWDQKKKQKGIKRFFGKLRRSSSQDMDGELEEFKRNGVRATAGPRLGWSKDMKYNDLDVPFARWDSDRVAAWLHSMGLSMYVGECKRWVRNGDQLLKATPHELEKELGLRHGLHRKKVQLALQAIGSDSQGRMDELDHNWVLRWLDDIGLPQYKDNFNEARVDGRLLHYLTVEDLLMLKVTNAMHHLSIKSSIQVLRRNNWNPGCLKRRPSPHDSAGPLHNIAHEVILWTNHRVMEWLRTIDLSEYAPNLRGSGVHGALMVLEPRFTAELFASLLSIPNSKTLLRRHLSTHFIALIGNEMQHRKREVEAQPGNIPLTPNQKLKLKKFGLFGHRRTRSDPDLDDYVCPMNGSAETNGWKGKQPGEGKHIDEKAAKEIGAYSQEINTLTTMLAKDQFLDDVPTSDV